jgi:predicted transcriptional regulator
MIKKKATDTTATAVAIATTTTSSSTTSLADVDNITIKERIQNATQGLSSSCFNSLHSMVVAFDSDSDSHAASRENALTICDYILSSLKSEINPSDHYRKDVIILLCTLSIFFKNKRSFNEITREDLLSFLDSFRKAEEVDPLHKWIGTYNLYRIHLMRFFK